MAQIFDIMYRGAKKGGIFFLIFIAIILCGARTASTAHASYGGLDWVVVTGPNQITATFEHPLATYDASTYTNLGLGLAVRNITGVIATTSNTITLGFDGPPVPPNTTGSIDVGPVDWADGPGGFAGGTGYPVDDGQSPALSVITLQDLDHSGGISPGDTLSFRFNEPMNPNITTDNLDTYFGMSNGHTFGTAAHGLAVSWTNSTTTLVVTLATDSALAPGDAVTPTTDVTDASYWRNPVTLSGSGALPFVATTSRTLYFYATSTYSDWTQITNWWTDAGHTIQASSLPNEYDDVIIDSTVSPSFNSDIQVHSMVFNSTDLADNSMQLNFFYGFVNAPGGIAVHNNWNLIGYYIGAVSFDGSSAAGLPFYIDNGFATYFSASNIVGNVSFSGTSQISSSANYGTINGNVTFNGYYGNAGLIYGDTVFNDVTTNPGIVFGHAAFHDYSQNGGIVHGNVDVYYPSANPVGGTVDGYIRYRGYSVDGGSGTPEDPYLLSSCSALEHINDNLSASYKLTADIDCPESAQWNENPDEWVDGEVGGTLIPDSYASTTHTDIIVENNGYSGFEPIGSNAPFTGTFDGDGHTISSIWIFRKSSANTGLFSSIQDATIKNVTLANSNIVGAYSTGGLVGTMASGTISHVSLENNMVRTYLTVYGGGLVGTVATGTLDHIVNTGGFVHGSGNIIGGLVGHFVDGVLSDSHSSAVVDGGLKIGGLVGEMDGGLITRSYATGEVISNQSEYVVMKNGQDAGGFIGAMNGGIITNSYATGTTTTSGGYGGGFAGYLASPAVISNSYATGNVFGVSETIENIPFTPNYVGGFVGLAEESHLSKTFATGDVNSVGDYVGGYAGDLINTTITDAYASGNVTGNSYVGGFTGHTYANVAIQNIYARGLVTSNHQETTSGLVGIADNDVVPTNSFWDIQTVDQPNQNSGIEKTTAQMTTASTFTDAGWDFTHIWRQTDGVNNGYPYFIYTVVPTVASTSPADGATNVDRGTGITVHFAIPMDPSSVVISTTTCGYACFSYAEDWSDDNQTLVLSRFLNSPGELYAPLQTYSVAIASAESADGLPLAAPYAWSFTTAAAEVTPAPVVVSQPTPAIHSGGYVRLINGTLRVSPTLSTAPFSSPATPTTPTPPTPPVLCSAQLYPTAVIQIGAQNDPAQVKLLEQYLNTFEGAHLPVNGIYSELDRSAVIAWQEKYASDILAPWNLAQGTGYVFKTSLQKFKSLFLAQCQQVAGASVSTKNIQYGMSGDDVRSLQKALIAKNTGPAAQALAKNGASGYFGELTKQALIEFQTSVGITPANGTYGPKTKAVLNVGLN